MLRTSNLHTHYGRSHVLQGLDIAAQSGEVIGIFGRNGAGKTTLLKTIAGWVRPSSGTVMVDAALITGLSAEKVYAHGVGFVPEDRRIFPGLSVEENLVVSLSAVSDGGAGRRSRLEAIYSRFPRLGERRAQSGTSLSGGEQQMLAIARALASKPKLLLIDEPSEGLAPKIVEEIFELIEELKRAGTTILLVEQNLDAALAASDRFYVIERGQVIAAGRSASPTDRDRLFEAVAV